MRVLYWALYEEDVMARANDPSKGKKVKVAGKPAAKAAAPRSAHAVAKPNGTPQARQGSSTANWSLGASTIDDSERWMTRAVSSVDTRPLGSGKAAIDDFQRMYSSLVRAVPNEFRLKLVEKMREGLGKVEQQLRAERLDAGAGTDGGRGDTADFVARLQRQEQERREQQIASGELLTSAELSARLSMTTSALTAAVKAKRMFFLKGPRGRNVYPAFFADKSLDRKVLEGVSKQLGDLPAASKYFFFTSPRTSLGGKSPLHALAKGKVDAVLKAAAAFEKE
jgi:hypothetical protein